MHTLTAVRAPRIPRVGDGDSTPLYAETVAATGIEPGKLFKNPLGSGKCSCDWAEHKLDKNLGGKGGAIGCTHHP